MSFTINTFEDKELPARLFDQVFPGFTEGGRGMKIIIDAFGGDNAPEAVLEGCALARSVLAPQFKLELVLTGDEEKIRAAAAAGQSWAQWSETHREDLNAIVAKYA